jgi:hypothetical protein
MNGTGNDHYISAEAVPTGLTLGALIVDYQTNRASAFHKQRYHTRMGVVNQLARLDKQHGAIPLLEIRASTIQIWYNDWAAGGHIATAHSFIAKLRTLFGFGLLMLEDRECERLSVVMSKLKFEQGQPRISWLTALQVDAVRETAREWFGWPSMALAQAFQFELMLRQKDVVGEWIPVTEPGATLVTWNGQKWLRGIVWEEIDNQLVLRHVTSKKQKAIQVDLKMAPMVMEELAQITGCSPAMLTRDMLPATGPVITNEINALPWSANEYRRKWRKVANHVGIPKEVRNQDSRSGGITEADEAGADIDHVRQAATHSDISQTQRYSRNATHKIATVQAKRLAHRSRTVG